MITSKIVKLMKYVIMFQLSRKNIFFKLIEYFILKPLVHIHVEHYCKKDWSSQEQYLFFLTYQNNETKNTREKSLKLGKKSEKFEKEKLGEEKSDKIWHERFKISNSSFYFVVSNTLYCFSLLEMESDSGDDNVDIPKKTLKVKYNISYDSVREVAFCEHKTNEPSPEKPLKRTLFLSKIPP